MEVSTSCSTSGQVAGDWAAGWPGEKGETEAWLADGGGAAEVAAAWTTILRSKSAQAMWYKTCWVAQAAKSLV